MALRLGWGCSTAYDPEIRLRLFYCWWQQLCGIPVLESHQLVFNWITFMCFYWDLHYFYPYNVKTLPHTWGSFLTLRIIILKKS
jgi:hypothetical protein